MSTVMTPATTGERMAQPLPRRTGPIIVATDGSATSNAALGAAFVLAEQLGAEVEVVAAREPLPQYGPLAAVPDLEDALDDRLRAAVRRQLSRSLARDAGWSVQVLHGSPADVIAHHAEAQDARIILVGRGPRDIRHSVFGGKLAMRLAQSTDVPILSVASPFHSLPRRALVALDFSPRSIQAAREGLALTSDIASIWLTHVVPRIDTTIPAGEAWQASYGAGLEEAFAGARLELEIPPAATVETLTLHGDAGRELITAATQIDADLIICGTHGRGFVQRMLLGDVATKLLRAATCSVLLVPNAARDETSTQPSRRRLAQNAWTETLRRFSDHNVGRRAILEIDDPAIGAQAQVVDYPFLGASYDPRTQRAELMFGGSRGTRAHLTHSIAGIRSIDVMEGGDGRDRVLRVAHDGGQTLMTLTT